MILPVGWPNTLARDDGARGKLSRKARHYGGNLNCLINRFYSIPPVVLILLHAARVRRGAHTLHDKLEFLLIYPLNSRLKKYKKTRFPNRSEWLQWNQQATLAGRDMVKCPMPGIIRDSLQSSNERLYINKVKDSATILQRTLNVGHFAE